MEWNTNRWHVASLWHWQNIFQSRRKKGNFRVLDSQIVNQKSCKARMTTVTAAWKKYFGTVHLQSPCILLVKANRNDLLPNLKMEKQRFRSSGLKFNKRPLFNSKVTQPSAWCFHRAFQSKGQTRKQETQESVNVSNSATTLLQNISILTGTTCLDWSHWGTLYTTGPLCGHLKENHEISAVEACGLEYPWVQHFWIPHWVGWKSSFVIGWCHVLYQFSLLQDSNLTSLYQFGADKLPLSSAGTLLKIMYASQLKMPIPELL